MGYRDSYSASVTIRCNGEAAIHSCVEAAGSFCAEAGIEGAPAARLAIIIEELVTNIADHGGMAVGEMVELTLRRAEGGPVSVVLSDAGIPFDPRGAPADEAIPDRGGGAGLNLVRSWAILRDYRRESGRNRLELELPVD
ncbi:MAG: ATP-binding protein [Pseudomonadota bacterium]